MRWSVAAMLLVPLRVAAGCGGETDSWHDAATDATTAEGSAADASSGIDGTADGGPADATSEKQWPIVYNVVDGGGDSPSCYPDGNIVQACCNGQPCRGFCLGEPDDASECSCYGITGGCVGFSDQYNTIPNVCCSTIRGWRANPTATR
jgi:hypothetical protein